jgi:hypothetical protein
MPTHKKKSKPPQKTSISPVEAQQEFDHLLQEFFDNYHLKDADDHLWNWLTAGISREHSIYDNGKERSNLIFFYENVKELIHKMWLLHLSRQHNAT